MTNNSCQGLAEPEFLTRASRPWEPIPGAPILAADDDEDDEDDEDDDEDEDEEDDEDEDEDEDDEDE
ncbi:MAG: hypothetical protein AB7O67_18425 [Vicinamibacterales bacterium]